jgi:hypothetical protein
MGCSSVTVNSDFDPEANFLQYKTFDWMPYHAKPSANPLMDKRIQSTVERELSDKGYQQRAVGKPDFLIAYHAGAKDKIDVDTYGYRYGRYGRRWGTYTTVREYKQARLVIDFIDAQSKELFWRGWAAGEFDNPEQAKEKAEEMIAKILAKYPPQ